jgi:hypothetical protein
LPSLRRAFQLALILGAILLGAAVILLGVVALAPFLNLNYGDIPSYLAVNNKPEAHLYYPGSTVLAVETLGQSTTKGDAIPAHSSALLATDATGSPSGVLAWYRDYLTRHGWTEVSAGTFRRSSEVFKVELWSLGQVRVTYAMSGCRVAATSCFGLIVGSNLPLPLASNN